MEGRDADNSQVIVHITEPANEAEYERGYLFMIAEANQATPKTTQTLSTWIEEIETSFYDEPLQNRPVEAHFEQLLERINRKSPPFLRLLEAQGEDLHILIGCVNEQTVSFALRGDPQGFISYGDKKGNRHTINIVAENKEADADEQIFGTIITGQLHDGDFAFFATPHIEDGFSNTQIGDILSSKSAEKATVHFQRGLEAVDNGFSFGGIAIERFKNDGPPPKIFERKSKPQESLRDLLSTQRSTEETLSPSLLGNLRKQLEQHLNKPAIKKESVEDFVPDDMEFKKPTRLSQKKAFSQNGILHTTGSWLYTRGKKLGLFLWVAIKWLTITLITLIETLYFVTTNAQGRRREFLDHWRKRIDEGWEQVRHWFGTLGLLQKLFLIGGTICILIFFISVGVHSRRQAGAARVAAYTTEVERIETLLSSAQSSLIYNEEQRARSLMSEATLAIATLPQDKDTEKATVTRLNDQVTTMRERIRHAQPAITTDLLDTASSGMTKPHDILLTTGLFLITDESQKLLVLERGSNKISIQENQPPFSPFMSYATDEDLVFFVNQAKAEQWKYKSDNTHYEISVPNNAAIKDALVYNDRLYTLVPEQKQIFRHDRHQEGFKAGTAWVKGSADLSEAQSFSIDSLIWVLMKNGSVKVFDRGQEKGFTLSSADPALTNPQDILAKFESPWLYIFDPANKRIVVFEKTGALKMQYTFGNATELRAFTIDEKKKLGFVLDGTKLKQFGLIHL